MADITSPRTTLGRVRPPLRRIDKYVRIQCSCLPKRIIVILLSCLGFMIIFSMRMIMGLTASPKWSEATRSGLDSALFWGYFLTAIPGGYLAAVLPANKVFGIGIAVSSLSTLLFPVFYQSPGILTAIKAIQGLAEGLTFPAFYGILGHWAPPVERSRLVTMAFCGTYIGSFLSIYFSAFLMGNLGQFSLHYFYGCAGSLWYLLWIWLVVEKPSLHPFIAAEELLYIENSLGVTSSSTSTKSFKLPWKAFFTSIPFYAIIVANFCRSWNMYLTLLFQALYIRTFFITTPIQNILLGLVSHLLLIIAVPTGGLLADWLIKNRKMTTTTVRKVFNSVSLGMEATFTIIMACTDTPRGAITAILFKSAFSGLSISGYPVNPLDLAPRYVSILVGFSNGVGIIAGLISIYTTHSILSANTGAEGWKKVFIIPSVIQYVGVILYALFASGELQPWADPPTQELPDEANGTQEQNNVLLQTQPSEEVNNCSDTLLLPSLIQLMEPQQPDEAEDSDTNPSNQPPSLDPV